MAKPDQGYITCWAIVMHSPHGYCIIGHHGLEGYNLFHENHKFIRTSPIVIMIETEDGFEVETRNSIYHIRGLSNDENGRSLYKAIYGRNPGDLK